MKKLYKVSLIVLLVFFTSLVWAGNNFVVQKIQVIGNRGLSKGTVLNYVPIRVGETFTESKSTEIIQSLYKSGFFTNVNLGREGNTLVIRVAERATIASVKVSGNEAIKKDELKKILKQEGLTTGSVYNQAVLSNFKEALHTEYYAMGYYNAKVDAHVTPLPRDRVAVNIDIHAGKIAKVKAINFVGNHSFSSSTLRDQMLITTPKLWSFITKGDRYSKAKLDASKEAIRSYYMNRGYIHFKIVSTNVQLSSNRESVYITIHVHEGSQYHFSGFTFSGKTIVPVAKLDKLVTFENGDTFSREKIEKSNQAIAFALGDKGYAFTQIDPIPKINEREKSVFINFHVIPGKQVYVRHIVFEGNTVTADYVLRRSMQQMEGGLLSSRKIQESVRKLKLLGFFSDVTVQTVPVPGTNNQVDLIYHVKETRAGQAMVSLGYGTLGFQIGAGITQPNFLGTGKTVGVNFTTNKYETSYSINYYNPYYTLNNIGRGINLFYTTTRPDKLNLSGSYSFDTYGGNVYYHIPVTLNNSVTVGYGFSHYRLKTFGCAPGQSGCTPVSNEVDSFVNKYGTNFNEVTLNAGWQYLGLDRAIFPTDGLTFSLNAEASTPISKKTLRYYKAGANAEYYLPLNRDHSFILTFRGVTAYGNGYGSTKGLPFFLNYYAGGLSQGLVRGYETNTLGPKDSNKDPIGGNFLVDGGVGFIFPNLISPDNLRTSIFFDVGNVFQTDRQLYTTGPGSVRMSAGLAVQWRSPVGPLEFSLGKAINKEKGDDTEPFQFTMGTSF